MGYQGNFRTSISGYQRSSFTPMTPVICRVKEPLSFAKNQSGPLPDEERFRCMSLELCMICAINQDLRYDCPMNRLKKETTDTVKNINKPKIMYTAPIVTSLDDESQLLNRDSS
jgi:hypothetical protein